MLAGSHRAATSRCSRPCSSTSIASTRRRPASRSSAFSPNAPWSTNPMPTVKNGNCTIWYDSMGDGPPVVMVYGIGGNSRGWWDEFPRLLSGRYRLIMLDTRGTGRSDKPDAPWTMSDMTADILAVVDDAGLDTFHLLGCSLGTLLARHFVGQRG